MNNYTLHHEHNGTHIRDASGGLVASLEAGSQDKRDRDGALIVRALNSHAPLVAALEALTEEIRAGNLVFRGYIEAETLKQAAAALAQAVPHV